VISLVPDTTVVVKVFLEEDESPHAQALFQRAVNGEFHLVAPDFMAIEFGNVLWKHARQARLTVEEARQAIDRLPFDHISWVPAEALLPRAFGFATRYGIALYDAAFVSVAEMVGADFVTADRALVRKVGRHLSWVRLLGDFSSPPSVPHRPAGLRERSLP